MSLICAPSLKIAICVRFAPPGPLQTIAAQASTVTFSFTGTVTSVAPALSGTFNTSQTLTGSLTYESTTAGSLNGTQSDGFSNYANALTSWVMTVGSYSASLPALPSVVEGLSVANNFGGQDRFVVSGQITGAALAGYSPTAFIALNDTSQTALADTSLTGANLNGWPATYPGQSSWYLAFGPPGGSGPLISGQITSFAQVVSTTPEPSSTALLSLALLTLPFVYRIRRAKRS